MRRFAIMRRDGSQRVVPPTPFVLPPLAKQILCKQHSQSDDNLFVNLATESKAHSHSVTLQRPAMLKHRGVIALSAICAQMSRDALRPLQSQLPIGIRITPPVYQERP